MNFKTKYPALSNSTYLDTASSGIISVETFKWRQMHDESFLNNGSYFRVNQGSFLNDVRDTLSDFFNANPDYCLLVPNFSFGFNTFLRGLNPTSKFLLLESDYPSVNYAVKAHGFPNETIAITSDLEENLFAKIEKIHPDVFACSLVQYLDGYKIDLDLLKRLKETFPKLIIAVDGTQYCGTENFDFKNSGIDFLGASGYKWMLAGYGNGFILLNDTIANYLYQEITNLPKPTESFLESRPRLATFFEPGHLDTLSFGSLQQAVIERKKMASEDIDSHIKKLGQQAAKGFESRAVLSSALLSDSPNQHIFNLNLSEKTISTLIEKKVIFTKRGAGIRVGFHFYNDQEDLNRLLSIIDGEY